jgi:hypothetical protein
VARPRATSRESFPQKPHWRIYVPQNAGRRAGGGVIAMCRNIKTLFNFEPPATEDEVRASALQFVRKLSGFAHPSKGNEAAFDRAVDEVTEAANRLLQSLNTMSPPRDREHEAEKARARAKARYA